MKSRFQKIRMFLKRKKKKFDSHPKVSNLMNGKCVCENPCNEYCDSKQIQEKVKALSRLGGGEVFSLNSDYTVVVGKPKSFNSTQAALPIPKPQFPDDRITSK